MHNKVLTEFEYESSQIAQWSSQKIFINQARITLSIQPHSNPQHFIFSRFSKNPETETLAIQELRTLRAWCLCQGFVWDVTTVYKDVDVKM